MKLHKTDNISICGYSHKIINKECQDSSISWQKHNYSGIIVCDGHGGDKYIRSAIGSKIACEVGKSAIDKFMNKNVIKNKLATKFNLTQANYDSVLYQLERSIIQRWNTEIENHYAQHPLENDDKWESLSEADKASIYKKPVKAYGTTFIAAVVTKNCYFVLKLGDGNANIIINDEIIVPKELKDDQLQFNMTTSMCSYSADNDFKHFFGDFDKENFLGGIVLTSDGVINCYKTEDAYNSFIKNVYDAYEEEEIVAAHSELINVLDILSEKGSGDDLSVAIIHQKT